VIFVGTNALIHLLHWLGVPTLGARRLYLLVRLESFKKLLAVGAIEAVGADVVIAHFLARVVERVLVYISAARVAVEPASIDLGGGAIGSAHFRVAKVSSLYWVTKVATSLDLRAHGATAVHAKVLVASCLVAS